MVESIFKDCTNPESHGKSLIVRKYLGSVAVNNITRLVLEEWFENEGVMDQLGLEFKAILENEGEEILLLEEWSTTFYDSYNKVIGLDCMA